MIDEVAAGIGADRITFAIGRNNTVWKDGVAYTFTGNDVMTLAGGSVQELSASNYLVTWSTGETLNVSVSSSYINVTTALSATDGPGSVQGLLGADSGQANDFQLANGTVLAQPITTSQLYGEFANAWRVTQADDRHVHRSGVPLRRA